MNLFQTKDSTKKRTFRQVSAFVLLAALFGLSIGLLSACGSNQPSQFTPTPTITLTPTATLPPTLTPTPVPLGSEGRPLVLALVSDTADPQIAAAAQELARQLSLASGLTVQGSLFPSYQSLMFEMREENVHLAWMPPLTYLYAADNSIATAGLLTNHFGVYLYGAQYLANIESNFTPYYDPIAGLSSETADVALAQFRGFRPCWVEPQSASGYIVPAGLMQVNGLPVLPAVITQSHTAVVRALYVKGICDFGATFSISGDPRTASIVQQDLPDVMNRIPIIWRTDAIIPNISMAYSTIVPEGDRQTLNQAFLRIINLPDGKALLSLSAGNTASNPYSIDDLRIIQDDTFDPLRQVVRGLNLNLVELLGK